MTTTAISDRRPDRVFFSTMAALILTTVFVGFARTYYLAGVFSAPLPSPIIHVHGAVFSSWILLLIAQTSLVATGRVDLHRRLGIAGFILAGLMFILGVLAGADGLRRGIGRDPLAFYVLSVARWPFDFVHRKPPIAYAVSYVFLLLLVAYDLWTSRKIHRSTLWAGVFIVVIHAISGPIAQTATWHSLARQVQTLARG